MITLLARFLAVSASGNTISSSNQDHSRIALQKFHEGSFDDALAASSLQIHDSKCDGDTLAEMHHIRAACFYQLNNLVESEKSIRLSIKLAPENSNFLNTYGVILRKCNRFEQAVRSYEMVMDLQPDFADVYYNCGNALNELDRKKEAISRFEQCLHLKPDHASAHHNVANCFRDLKLIEQALSHFHQSDQIEHVNPDMHCNWGLTLQLQERWDLAIEQFEIAITQKSDHAPSYINLGSALSVKERFDEACEALRHGVFLDDSCNDAKFNLGLTLLTIGEFDEGWHFYDTRLRLPDKVRSPIELPMWDGKIETLQGEPLLVWAEQGFGDNIQFARYVSILIEAGVQVTLSTRKPLIPLMKACLSPHCPAIIEHIPSNLQGFRHHVPLLSLPRLCGTTSSTIPMMPGYICKPLQIPDRLRIHRQPFALHIGLVWASGADNKDMYADKSMSLSPIMNILDRWRKDRFLVVHSMQIGDDADQLSPWLGQWGVIDHSTDINDFLDSACLLSQFDLVISVDTAVAHLAGALDLPVWTLLQHNADFRWMRGRNDSPWYRSMTLIRQQKLGDWSSVIQQIDDQLSLLLGDVK